MNKKEKLFKTKLAMVIEEVIFACYDLANDKNEIKFSKNDLINFLNEQIDNFFKYQDNLDITVKKILNALESVKEEHLIEFSKELAQDVYSENLFKILNSKTKEEVIKGLREWN